MSHKVLFTCLLVTLLVLIPGCAKAPSEAVAATDAAFESLSSVQADLYAGPEFEQAQAALAAARTELEAQNAKFALSRRYAEAEQLFATARTRAESAAAAARAGQQAAETGAVEAIELARYRIAESAGLIEAIKACPRKAKDITTDTALLEGRIDGFADTIPALVSMLSGSDFLGAQSEATTLIEQLDAISGDLTTALGKLGCAPPAVDGETST